MAKMKKEYNPNKAARRKRRPIIYVICEGKETERVEQLVKDETSVISCGSNPVTTVYELVEFLNNQRLEE